MGARGRESYGQKQGPKQGGKEVGRIKYLNFSPAFYFDGAFLCPNATRSQTVRELE